MKNHRLRDIESIPGFAHAGIRLNAEEIKRKADAVAPCPFDFVRVASPELARKAARDRDAHARFAALRRAEGGAR
jgi:hypothetical protein